MPIQQLFGWPRRGGPNRPKVFGVGMIKTGTSTLGACLRKLGYRHVSHRRDLLAIWSAGEIEPLMEVADQNDSFEDLPWFLIYREVYERYGNNARFVLTTRKDSRTWLESLKKHSVITDPIKPSRSVALGYDYPHGYEKEHIELYEHHNGAVREFFSDKPGLLLEVCWERGDGWNELCTFLGRPVPRTQMPHANRSAKKLADASVVAANQVRIRRQIQALAGS